MPSGSRVALVALLAALVLGPAAASPVTGAATGVGPGLADGPTADRFGPTTGAPSAVAVERGPVTPAVAAIADADLRRSNTTMRVQLTADGDARWRVSARINLTDEADREAFRETAREFARGEVTGGWLSVFREARSEASRATGRGMRIHSPDRTWSINETGDGNATGQLTLTFTWTNFARVTDDGRRLEIGDAFETTGGTWLERLEPGQTLVVQPPADYTPETGSGDLRERSFYWVGPQSFESNPPSAIFTGGGGLPTLMVASLVVAGLTVLLLLVYLLASRRGVLVDRDDDADGGAAAASAAGATSGTSSDEVEEAGDSGDAEVEDDVDVELLSDEERVERLLDRNGGRMKQASIVKETGWSNAKVSQLLSAMADEDRIDKLRIGRENLISFPDEDVADVEE